MTTNKDILILQVKNMQQFKKVGDTLPSFAVKMDSPPEEQVTPDDIFVKEKIADPPKLVRQEAISLDPPGESGKAPAPVVQEISKEKVGRGKRGPDRAKRKKRQMTPEALEKLAKAREKALRVRRERAAERKRLKQSQKAQLKKSPPTAAKPPVVPEPAPKIQMSKFDDEDYDSYIQFKEFQRRQRARKKRAAAAAPARQPAPVRTKVRARQEPPAPRKQRPAQNARARVMNTLRRPPPVNPWESCFNYQ